MVWKMTLVELYKVDMAGNMEKYGLGMSLVGVKLESGMASK